MQALIDRYSGVLYGFGLRRLGDPGMAEELVQDTFVRLWRSSARFDPERGSVRSFVYAIARNCTVDLQRRRASKPLPAAEGVDALDRTIDDPGDSILLGLELRAAIGALSHKHRETIELAYDKDLTQSQIAERLGIPLGTVKTRAYHALRALRIELEERGIAI